VSFGKPKQSQAARAAALQQQATSASDAARNRSLRDLIKTGNRKSYLLGGTESGLRTQMGVGVPGTPAGRQ